MNKTEYDKIAAGTSPVAIMGHPVTIPPMTRTFDTGATRDTQDGKLDFEGFLSPLVMKRYAEYLNGHRTMKDGSTRDSDNWQKGIPLDVYMKSAFRHFMDMWMIHRKWNPDLGSFMEDAMCGLLFNTMGYLHERLKAKLLQDWDATDFPIEVEDAMKDAKSIASEKAFDEADLASQIAEGLGPLISEQIDRYAEKQSERQLKTPSSTSLPE